MNIRYFDLSEQLKINLSNEDFESAVKLEAINRGIALPITLSEVLRRYEYKGFTIPADAVAFYQVTAPARYGGNKPTGVCYRTEEQAVAALDGAICVDEDGYGNERQNKIVNGDFSVSKVWVSLSKPKAYSVAIEEYAQDDSEFEKLVEECRNDWRAVCQKEYDNRVNLEKKAQYLRLAQDNEEIAKAFWSKSERAEWPA